MIEEYMAKNFQTMLQCAKDGNLALMECTDVATGKPAYIVTMMNVIGDEYEAMPIARLFSFDDGDNPLELYEPPSDMDELASEVAERTKDRK